ncbi:helicase HerA-like domain-containing protein, partial [Actinotalea sp.]|uniref:helicase HerA-like domain-containing protein n=1 Tax=Actinotalea sp. TaxID=1872145 RepID=UPI00356845C7
ALAAAEAAEAKARALKAAVAAGATPGVPEPAAGPTGTPEPAPAAPEPAAPQSAWAQEVSTAYTFGAGLPLGALVEDGTAAPGAQVALPLAMMNRHGLVAGATGTGKTKTLQVMAEGLSAAGVPVFVADIKGDLSGLMVPGTSSEKLLERTTSIGQDWTARGFPVELYRLGDQGTGTPIRTTVTDFGPLLLSKVLGLNATQESSLGLIFHWADTQGLALLDLKDLRATITYLVSDEGKAELKGIGGLSAATAGVILREIVGLQAQGADVFFGEPAFETGDLLRTAPDGRGVISALELPSVQDRPALFSTFLMWLLADLFSELPEVGDAAEPKLVFFFDEAHLLFTDASKDFLTEVTQTVRLIRSKGVGVFFVTQTPKDVPADVLAQLGNRVQHALRAYTPDDATALRATARTFPNSDYDLEELLTTLGTGEALVTVLSEKGAPTPVAWTRLRAPESAMAPAGAEAMTALVAASPQGARYATAVDRESAYELLTARAARAEADATAAAAAETALKEAEAAAAAAKKEAAARAKELERIEKEMQRDASSGRSSSRRSTNPLDSFLRSAGTQLGREITRTIFGTRRR